MILIPANALSISPCTRPTSDLRNACKCAPAAQTAARQLRTLQSPHSNDTKDMNGARDREIIDHDNEPISGAFLIQ
jgi:hypothetical protein